MRHGGFMADIGGLIALPGLRRGTKALGPNAKPVTGQAMPGVSLRGGPRSSEKSGKRGEGFSYSSEKSPLAIGVSFGYKTPCGTCGSRLLRRRSSVSGRVSVARVTGLNDAGA